MPTNPVKRRVAAPDDIDMAALARLTTASYEIVERDTQARIAMLEAQALRYETAIDKIS